jgi:hypothetical protein
MIVLPTEKKPNINAPPTILPKWNRKALEKGWKAFVWLIKIPIRSHSRHTEVD